MTIIIILWSLGLVIYFNLKNYLYDKNLFENKINAKVKKVELLNRGGYKYFYLDTFFWGSSFSADRDSLGLTLGDSLSKNSNSLKLDVYRKTKGKAYKYLTTFYGHSD